MLRRLREQRVDDLPDIILTARSSVTDTVAGLEGGADEYNPSRSASDTTTHPPGGPGGRVAYLAECPFGSVC